jgi:hypothetical protein
MNVFAGGNRRQRHFLVNNVGRGDRNDTDLGIGDQLLPIGGHAPEA